MMQTNWTDSRCMRRPRAALTDNCSIEPGLAPDMASARSARSKGRGVLAGLTNISEIESNKQVNGETVPCEGRLFYRGYDIIDLVGAESREHRFGLKRSPISCSLATCPREELDGFQPDLRRTLPHAADQPRARRHHLRRPHSAT